jgi:hypothetical protein
MHFHGLHSTQAPLSLLSAKEVDRYLTITGLPWNLLIHSQIPNSGHGHSVLISK